MDIVYIVIFVLTCIASYFLGNVSIARLITKKQNGGISNQGSGNPGTMNMLRTQGLKMGLFTLLCDALKGFLPALFGLLYFGGVINTTFGYVALYSFGLCAVLGHMFPVFYKFKGGKGIATTFGMFMVADPISATILFGILFITLYFIKIGSIVSLLFITIEGFVQIFRPIMDGNWVAILIMWAIIVLDIYAHRTNLLRIIENKENPADLQEGLKKDIKKIQEKRERKLEKTAQKSERIEKKYDNKISRKSEKVQKKIDKINTKSQTE